MARFRRLIVLLSMNAAVVLLLFLLVEGAASVSLIVYDDWAGALELAERFHTRYDEDLGWVNVENASIPEMYSPGIGLYTNAQRYRNKENFSKEVPEGGVRIICSGESFTLGYGVSNRDAWCNQLSNSAPLVEAVPDRPKRA